MANVITTLLKMDSTQFKTGMRQAQQSIHETDGLVNKAKAGWTSAFAGFASSPVAIGAATAAVGAFAASSIRAASDLDESINAVNVTFGESADKILEFGDNAARSVGLAKSEFNQLATPLGSILKNAGTPLDDVADKTITLTQRAADMASVFNTDVSDALMAIQAGLRGEQDPLEQYGVSLSAAKVEARALADTGKDNVKALTDLEKQTARVEIILDQTNQTAGDFAETSGGLANQTRILNAEFENLKAKAGEKLVPILSDLAGLLLDIEENAGKAKSAIEELPGGESLLDALGTNLFELPRKSKHEWDELGRKIGIIPDEVAKIGSKRAEFEAIIARGNEAKDAFAGAAVAAGETAEEVADLGDKAANSGPKIGDMSGALDDAEQHLADLNEQARDNALNTLAAAIQGVKGALDDAFGGLEDDLGQLDLFDDIQDQLVAVQEAAEAMASGGAEEARDYNREVRRLQGQLLDFLRTVEDIPPDKQVEILAQIRTGDVETLKGVLDELTQDRWINIGFRPNPQQAFSSVNGVFTPGGAPSTPIFNNPNPAPTSGGYVDNRNITIINPVGSTPTTQYIDAQTDFRRNGAR